MLEVLGVSQAPGLFKPVPSSASSRQHRILLLCASTLRERSHAFRGGSPSQQAAIKKPPGFQEKKTTSNWAFDRRSRGQKTLAKMSFCFVGQRGTEAAGCCRSAGVAWRLVLLALVVPAAPAAAPAAVGLPSPVRVLVPHQILGSLRGRYWAEVRVFFSRFGT